ncbi:MAG: DUF2339 domain-containing protein [Erythrobacter sp.]
MEWLFIFGLAGVVAWLWQRLDKAEQKLERLDELQDRMFDAMRAMRTAVPPETAPDAVEPAPQPEPSDVTVPKAPMRADPEQKTIQDIVEPEPVAHSEPPAAASPEEKPADRTPLIQRFSFDLEDVFGRRLPIWAGGVTLAVAGVFLVRYSIERGLITPLLRVIMAFVFGGGLIAGAEAAYRFRERVADPRVAQALAGAGLATLYAGFYLAGSQYGLIGQTLAFLGLAAVTAGAIALSFRFGLPSAVLGLVGGFAAPALVGGDSANLPLLALYLGLVTAGLSYAGREQKREWMGIAAMIGGLGWGAVLLLAGDPGLADVLALGLYFVVLGTVLPVLTGGGRFERPMRFASALVASVQLALLVDQGGYSPLAWALYLLLGATLAFFGWKRPELREGNAIAAAVGTFLLAMWSPTDGVAFALVATAMAAVFAGVPLFHLWRSDERNVDLAQLGAVPLALFAVAYMTFGNFLADRVELALASGSVALASLPALGVWRLWSRGHATTLAAGLAVVAMLTLAAGLMLSPAWLAPLVAGAVFAGLFLLVRGRSGDEFRILLWAFAVAIVVILLGHEAAERESMRFFGEGAETLGLLSLLRYFAPLAALGALAWREVSDARGRQLAEGAAALFAYGALAQVLPGWTLAWMAAGLAIALAHGLTGRKAARLVPAVIAGLWALGPFFVWLESVVESLFADPVFVGDLPSVMQIARYMLPVAAALALARLPALKWRDNALAAHWLASLPLGISAHVLFKQGLAVDTLAQFVERGLLERTLWEALLLAGGWAALKRFPWLGQILIGAALAHFALYSGLLHNPLWDRQAVGGTPVANLALAAYAIAVGAVLLLRPRLPHRLGPVADGLVVLLVSLGSLTLLRQIFAGSILTDTPMTQTEDLLRSLLGILLAIGFLFLGSRLQQRSWRVGSLVLILLAVAKVFIVDAAGLEGLLRIASFMALGFSLIGIGWVYSRQLRAAPAEMREAQ